MSLADQQCIPCSLGTPPMKQEEAEQMLADLGGGWELHENGRRLFKRYTFKNFKRALKFVNLVGEQAEEVGHHPNIHFTWGMVELLILTHKIDALAGADFILAAKLDRIFEENFPKSKAKAS